MGVTKDRMEYPGTEHAHEGTAYETDKNRLVHPTHRIIWINNEANTDGEKHETTWNDKSSFYGTYDNNFPKSRLSRIDSDNLQLFSHDLRQSAK